MRLFVAAWLSVEVADALAGLPRPEAPGLRWTRPDQWHVTLRFLGEADPGEVTAALDELAATPAVAELGPVTRLLGKRVVVAAVAGLDDLAASVVAATAGVGEPPEERAFTGHLTLARSKGPVPPGAVGTPVAGSFLVDEVCLVRSRTLPEGAAYETLARFRLG
ncbi:MAG: RNA 2',3'-cyclic phosphodiesterase [Acidimicrobiaceae bacterium]|nr:RNA 2',3'-cyclic phosphodiesterase [Acidimicrobiaceae bacterium]